MIRIPALQRFRSYWFKIKQKVIFILVKKFERNNEKCGMMINIDIIVRWTNNEQRKEVNFFPSYLHIKSSSQFLFEMRIADIR